MKKQIVILGLMFPFVFGCVKVEPFVDLKNSSTASTISTSNQISEVDQQNITKFIQQKSRFDACVVLYENKLLYQYGDKNIPYNCASVRKSIFGALFGIAAKRGIINLDASLKDLGIDDKTNPLTDTEKTATIRHLLTARSGIYLPSLGESAGMKKRKPNRGTYLPNQHFYYNNWDFNALPIILEKLTGKKIGQLIYEWIAVPCEMQNFLSENVTYEYDSKVTEYPQTRVYISAEDLARFGSLYLTDGKWNGKEVIPSDWVKSSVTAISNEPKDADLLEHPTMEGYGYLWWIDNDEKTFWAEGAGGHFCIIDKTKKMVVVVRNNTGMSGLGTLIYNTTAPYQDTEIGNEVYKYIKSKF